MLALVSFVALAQQTVDVGIAEHKFVPGTVHIKAGDTVRWTNHEQRTSHSVLFPGNPSLESDRLFSEESWLRRFDKAGHYPYRCGPHPEMQGVVEVGD